MNSETNLDILTEAVKTALQGREILNVTKQSLSRGYSLSSSDSSKRTSPYGRYQVHIVAQRDNLKAVAMFMDYGIKGTGASSTRIGVTLDNFTDLATQVGSFLTTGKRG